MKKTKFIIFAPSYNENSGGIIVLHHLCHLINSSELNVEAYIKPYYNNYIMTGNIGSDFKSYLKIVFSKLRNKVKFHSKDIFNTPLHKGGIKEDDIIIYPEITVGNPLKAKNIIRWLLHKPGYHTGNICYGVGELYFKYQSGLVNRFDIELNKLSNKDLYTPYIPLDIYNMNDSASIRSGCAYSIRKGKDKKQDKHSDSAICIDNLSHVEISNIFKKVKRFISYDAYSAYIGFAVLCGCEVIVIPETGISKIKWQPVKQKRYGIAYGFGDLEWANSTRNLRLPYIESINIEIQKNVDECLVECIDFFSKK